jgi:hypothetical protein
MYHLEKTLPRSLREARKRSARYNGYRIVMEIFMVFTSYRNVVWCGQRIGGIRIWVNKILSKCRSKPTDNAFRNQKLTWIDLGC